MPSFARPRVTNASTSTPVSGWSAIPALTNLNRGRMRPAGLAEVAAAKADGRWDAAYASQRDAGVPSDLAAALAENPRAAGAFEALGKTGRYQVILQPTIARTEAARAARLRKALAALTDRPGRGRCGRAARIAGFRPDGMSGGMSDADPNALRTRTGYVGGHD